MEPTNCSHPISKETYVHIWKDAFFDSRNTPKPRYSECFSPELWRRTTYILASDKFWISWLGRVSWVESWRSGDARLVFWRQINWSCIRSRRSRAAPCIQEKQPVININANSVYITTTRWKTRWNTVFRHEDDYDMWYEKRLVCGSLRKKKAKHCVSKKESKALCFALVRRVWFQQRYEKKCEKRLVCDSVRFIYRPFRRHTHAKGDLCARLYVACTGLCHYVEV